MLELLQKLSRVDAPSGFEHAARELVQAEVAPHVDEIHIDALGNLHAIKHGESERRLLVAAHLDEIGLLTTHIDEHGFLRFTTLGGHSAQTLLKTRVRSLDGVVGVIDTEELDDPKKLALKHLYIDIGAEDRAAAERVAPPGTAFVFDVEPATARGQVIGKALDDRAGCAVLISALKQLEKPPITIVAVFTVQEEVGTRGARVSGFGVQPDLALAIDVTPTGDTPKSRPLNVALGKGAAVKMSDRGLLAHPQIKEWLFAAATRAGVPHQIEVLPYGSTDAGAIHVTRAGVRSGAISIPLRHLHSPVEQVALSDMEAARDLLLAAIDQPPAQA